MKIERFFLELAGGEVKVVAIKATAPTGVCCINVITEGITEDSVEHDVSVGAWLDTFVDFDSKHPTVVTFFGAAMWVMHILNRPDIKDLKIKFITGPPKGTPPQTPPPSTPPGYGDFSEGEEWKQG
jgi:hypothetical protein